MPPPERREAPPIAHGQFDPSTFNEGDEVAYYDDTEREWKIGVYSDVNKRGESPTNVLGVKDENGEEIKVVLTVPPRTFHNYKGGTLFLNEREYAVLEPKIDPRGNIEYDLETKPAGSAPKEVIRHVNERVIEMYMNVREIEGRVRSRVDEVRRAAGDKHRQILDKLRGLGEMIAKTLNNLGQEKEWELWGRAEIDELKKTVDDLQTEANSAVADVTGELWQLEGMIVTGLVAQMAEEVTTAEALLQDFKQRFEANERDWAEYERQKKAPAQSKGGGAVSSELLMEPSLPREENAVAYQLFEELQDQGAFQPAIGALQPTSYQRLKEEIDRRVQESKRAHPVRSDEDIRGEKALEVLKEWQTKSKTVKEYAFDFNKDKAELEKKAAELMKRLGELIAATQPVDERQKTKRGRLDKLNTDLQMLQTQIVVPQPPATSDIQQEMVLKFWKGLTGMELSIFQEELAPTAPPETEKETEVAAIPSELLFEILQDDAGKMRAIMREIFSGQSNIDAQLKMLFFDKRPSEKTLSRLRQHGIKDWPHFQIVWERAWAARAAGVLREWADDETRAYVLLNKGWLDRVATRVKQIWSIRDPLAHQLGVTGLCVGVPAITASFLAGGGGWGAIATVAGVGAVGGAARGLLHKFVYGKKERVQELDAELRRVEEEDNKKLMEEQKTQAVDALLDRMFGEEPSRPDEQADVEKKKDMEDARKKWQENVARQFSSMLAQAMKEAGDATPPEGEGGIGKEQEILLSHRARHMYREARRELAERGEGIEREGEKKERNDLKDAIYKLRDAGDARAAEALREASEPNTLVRWLESGTQAATGTAAAKESLRPSMKALGASALVGASVGVGLTVVREVSGWWGAATGAAVGSLTRLPIVVRRGIEAVDKARELKQLPGEQKKVRDLIGGLPEINEIMAKEGQPLPTADQLKERRNALGRERTKFSEDKDKLKADRAQFKKDQTKLEQGRGELNEDKARDLGTLQDKLAEAQRLEQTAKKNLEKLELEKNVIEGNKKVVEEDKIQLGTALALLEDTISRLNNEIELLEKQLVWLEESARERVQLEAAQRQHRDDITRLRAEAAQLDGEKNFKEQESTLPKERVALLEQELSPLREELGRQERELNQKKTRLASLEESSGRRKGKQIKQLRREIFLLQQKVDELTGKITSVEQEVTELNNQIAAKEQEVTRLNDQIAAKGQEVTKLNNEIAVSEGVVKKLDDFVDAPKETRAVLNGRLTRLRAEQALLAEKKEQIKGRIISLRGETENLEGKLSTLESNRDVYEWNLAGKKQDRDSLQSRINLLDVRQRKLDKEQGKLADLGEQLTNRENELKTEEERLKEEQTKLEELEKLPARLEEIEKYRAALEDGAGDRDLVAMLRNHPVFRQTVQDLIDEARRMGIIEGVLEERDYYSFKTALERLQAMGRDLDRRLDELGGQRIQRKAGDKRYAVGPVIGNVAIGAAVGGLLGWGAGKALSK